MQKPLAARYLKREFKSSKLGIKSTKDLDKLKGIIGQKRAVSSLKFGLEIDGCGYNVYVSGPPGTGKMTSVESFLEDLAKKKDTPPDWCYVNNFDDPYQPKSIQLPTGKGTKFKKDMDNLIEHIEVEIPKAFESDKYTNQKDDIVKGLQNEQNGLSKKINQVAEEKGFKLQSTPMGIAFVPMKEEKPMTQDDLNKLSGEEREKLEDKQNELQDELKTMMKKHRQLDRKIQEEVKELDKKIVENIVSGLIDDLKEKYENNKEVVEHLKEVQKDIIENADAFKQSQQQQQQQQSQMAILGGGQQKQAQKESITQKYKVNVFVDNAKQKGAPVITEFNPTFNNLLGRIEKEMQMGALSTDFTMIKAGSIPRANGGYLVIPIEDVLRSPYSYDGLKRTLKSSEVQIEEIGERLGFLTTKSLRPQPIKVNVKVVLVGSPIFYYLLQQYDEDFSELFKVKADYDVEMENGDKNVKDFLSFISTYCEKQNLNHLDRSAVAKLLEQSARMADDQEKLSTEFGHITDLIREANYWSKQNNGNMITKKHVEKALDERIYRNSLYQDKIKEMIKRGTILIDTEKEVVGQVNGLSVISLGHYMFGRPSRITSTVAPGRDGIIDIEREVKLGGPIHSKGILILSGYLTNKFAIGKPLTLSARIVFEQSYQGVEGDSASAAELFATLSALSEVPIKQGIAVTGSVNQMGEIQAIGGVNHKIEGYFQVCKETGLNGAQGVIIPASNEINLMLRDEVIDAVKAKKFKIWSIKTIDEGIEILTGKKAGELKEDGTFTKNSINELVRQKLEKFEGKLKEMKDEMKK